MNIGTHKFSMICTKMFFEEMKISDFKDGAINIEINMEKQEHLLQFYFTFKGKVQVECTRCLDLMDWNLNFSNSLIVKIQSVNSLEINTEDDEVWIIGEEVSELDFTHYIYESIMCEIPIQKIHPNDSNGHSLCNPKMIKRLNQKNIKTSEIDPRWEVLEKIKKTL